MSEEESLYKKVAFIGEEGVGKTSIISRLINNNFRELLMSTVGSNFVTKEMLIKDYNQSIKFEIWDLAGQEKYRALARVFIKNVVVIILIYDITERKSFEEIKNYWINEIKANISTKPNNS